MVNFIIIQSADYFLGRSINGLVAVKNSNYNFSEPEGMSINLTLTLNQKMFNLRCSNKTKRGHSFLENYSNN